MNPFWKQIRKFVRKIYLFIYQVALQCKLASDEQRCC